MFNWNIVPHEPTSVRVIFNEYKKENSHATACAIIIVEAVVGSTKLVEETVEGHDIITI